MITVAILGAGIGAQHLEAYRALSHMFEVRMLVDHDTERARDLDPALHISTEINDALNDPEIDVVDICLPPHLHVSTAIDALAAGKHVICEKPIATSLADIERLRAAIKVSRAQYFPVFQYRFGPAFSALKRLISCGLAGNPQVASLETHWSRDGAYYAVPWRGTWAGEQGGAVLGHAIHIHDLLTHFMGPVRSLTASTATRVNPIETEDCAAIAFDLTSGALATSSITLGAASDETRLRLVFEGLTATSSTIPYAPATGQWSFVARDAKQQPDIDQIVFDARDAKVGYLGAFEAIADALSGDAGGEVTFEDGAASIELVTAIYAAAQSGERVTLPIAQSHKLFGGWRPI